MVATSVKYYFVHKFLPGFIFNNENDFIKIFVKGKEQFFEFLYYAWDTTKINVIGLEDKRTIICEIDPKFSVFINEISEDILMGIIKIPEPDRHSEALYVGFTFGNCKVRYFIYELGIDIDDNEQIYFVSERDRDGDYLNYGSCQKADIQSFIRGVKDVLTF